MSGDFQIIVRENTGYDKTFSFNGFPRGNFTLSYKGNDMSGRYSGPQDFTSILNSAVDYEKLKSFEVVNGEHTMTFDNEKAADFVKSYASVIGAIGNGFGYAGEKNQYYQPQAMPGMVPQMTPGMAPGVAPGMPQQMAPTTQTPEPAMTIPWVPIIIVVVIVGIGGISYYFRDKIMGVFGEDFSKLDIASSTSNFKWIEGKKNHFNVGKCEKGSWGKEDAKSGKVTFTNPGQKALKVVYRNRHVCKGEDYGEKMTLIVPVGDSRTLSGKYWGKIEGYIDETPEETAVRESRADWSAAIDLNADNSNFSWSDVDTGRAQLGKCNRKNKYDVFGKDENKGGKVTVTNNREGTILKYTIHKWNFCTSKAGDGAIEENMELPYGDTFVVDGSYKIQFKEYVDSQTGEVVAK